MTRKYLVCREQIVRYDDQRPNMHRISSSEYWPMIVEIEESPHRDSAEEILRKAFSIINPSGTMIYSYRYEYIIVPMDKAIVASLRPPEPPVQVHIRKF